MSSEVADGLGEPRTEDVRSVRVVGKRFVAEFQRDDLPGQAAEVAYHLIFAVPPLIILVVMAAALLNEYSHLAVVSTLHSFVDKHAPASTIPVLDSVIDNAVGKVGGGAASIGAASTALIALWSGSNAIGSFMKAFNCAYDVDEARSFIKKKLVALGLTLALIVVLVLSFALFVFGRQIGVWIADQVGLGSAFSLAWSIGRWPVGVILVMVLLTFLYYLGPNVEQSFRWITVGSVAATLLWIVAFFGFKIYLTIANPGSTYGAFGGLIVFLFFLYITSLIFIIGAELNATLENRFDKSMAGGPLSGGQLSVDGGVASRSVRLNPIQLQAQPEPEDPPDDSSRTTVDSATDSNSRGRHMLLTGFTAAGVAGALGWLVGRRGSRVG